MEQLPGLPPEAFDKEDPSPDAEFYNFPRFVTHIDDGAIASVTRVYRETLPPGGTILDLMSSWVSHLPADVAYGTVVGHGMNAEELAANPRLSRWFMQDLNVNPALGFGNREFDGACLCVSVQYLQRPVEVFREVRRVLRPGAPLVVSFSNRCFPTKAVSIWLASSVPDQQRLIGTYMRAAGFTRVTQHTCAGRSAVGRNRQRLRYAWHGALAPIDRPGYAQRGDGRSRAIPVTKAQFSKVGDPRYFWVERVSARDVEISLTWYDIAEPLLIHTQPNADPDPAEFAPC